MHILTGKTVLLAGKGPFGDDPLMSDEMLTYGWKVILYGPALTTAIALTGLDHCDSFKRTTTPTVYGPLSAQHIVAQHTKCTG